MKLKDKYQIEESSSTFSIQPLYHCRKKLLWYGIAVLFFGALSYYFLIDLHTRIISISIAIVIIVIYSFLKDVLFNIPIKYTFNTANNTVYRSNLFYKNKKVLALDEVVIFQSSEMGSWCYKMGAKKNHFVKNFIISENFTNKKNDKALIAYDSEILNKIEKMIAEQINQMLTKESNPRFNR